METRQQLDIPIYQQIANYIQKRIAYDVLYSNGMIERIKKGYIRLTFGRVDSHLISEGVQRLKRSFVKVKK